jgi:signal transduction histidine kinase/CheY-like chemotaxis protein
MFDFLSRLFDTSGFPARWHCGSWTDGHGWLHILSDLVVWSAYLAIPCVLAYFMLRRKDLPFRLVFLLFGAFILACGSTHLMDAILFWWPAYRLSGVLKLITAVVSWATVFALASVVPKALTLRSPVELEREVNQRRLAEEALHRSYGELEQRVRERTEELAAANEALRAEIGERGQVEDALRDSRQFLASSLDALSAHIAVLDESGTILMANERWRRFAEANGYTGPNSGIGTNYLQACDIDGFAESGDRTASDGIRDVLDSRLDSFELEYPCHGPNERRWFLMRVNRFEAAGAVRAVVAHENISDRKRAEESLRAARDEAERANKAKDQFLAVLSHELRTPLNPILLAVSSMLDSPPSEEDLLPTIEMVRQNVNLQARLIDDLLDVMRIVQGKMPLYWSVVDCHEVIRQAVEICQSEIHGKGHQLVLDLSAGDHHVNADSARLQQVLWNLIKNAVKFTPERGTITVRTRNEGEAIAIEVADSGIGIEPELLIDIFDPFQQGETTITRQFGGLGLGLAICKGVVDSHGGTIAVESDGKGRGTTFRISMKTIPNPAATEGVLVGTIPRNAPSMPTSLRILIVEDEPATLRLMARLLRGLGHFVATANSIDSGYEVYESGEFDLIVSDIGLPDGTGLELMRRVVALRGQIPAIALTGYGMEEDIQKSREAGFTTHMTKPIDFTKLAAMIQQVAN